MKIKTKRGARRIRNQRVVTRRFVVTDYTGCPYITAGKRYECNDGYISGDTGYELYIIRPDSVALHCKHLHDVGTWRYAVI